MLVEFINSNSKLGFHHKRRSACRPTQPCFGQTLVKNTTNSHKKKAFQLLEEKKSSILVIVRK